MAQLTIEKTRDYLVLKIPLKSISEKRERIPISSGEQRVIFEGLKALEEGRVSKSFRSAKEAIAFLRNI